MPKEPGRFRPGIGRPQGADGAGGPGRQRQRRWGRVSQPCLPETTHVGPVAIWWIPRPPAPRMSVRSVGLAWLAGLPVTAGTLLWMKAQSLPLWPFGRPISSPAEILLRYEIILLVYLGYVTLKSLPAWLRHHRLARQDALAIDVAIREEAWERTALLVHRYCLLVSAIWHRVSARVSAWDSLLRKRLPRHRRLYVYYHGDRPALPPDAAASFTPAIVPPRQPSLWSAAALIPVAFLFYLLVEDIRRRGDWQRLLLFNAVLLLVIMLSYGAYFLLAAMGRSHYFRFAPGVIQYVKFTIRRRRPLIDAFDLRRMHMVLDVAPRWLAITLLDEPHGRRRTFQLPKTPESLDAILRAALSSAPSQPLPEDGLLG